MTEERGPIDPDAFYTLKEARTHLRISDATARRWVKSGRLPAEKFGRDYRVRGEYLARRRRTKFDINNLKVLTPDSPLLKMAGMGDSGLEEVSANKKKYLAEIYYEKAHLRPRR
jgi:excisionase family DNA binding protein